jgi:hypothetical protein
MPGSQAERIRPVGNGMIGVLSVIPSSGPMGFCKTGALYSLLRHWTRNTLRRIAFYHTVPYGTDPGLALSRHFMPGYYHSVPPGQRPTHHTRNPEEPFLSIKWAAAALLMLKCRSTCSCMRTVPQKREGPALVPDEDGIMYARECLLAGRVSEVEPQSGIHGSVA